MVSKELKLASANHSACDPGYRVGPYIRDVNILHYIVSGKGTLESGGKVYPLQAGQVFLIYAGERVCYYADQTDPWTYTWVDFVGDQALSILNKTAFSTQNPVTPQLNPDEVYPRFTCMYDKYGDESLEYEGVGLLYCLLSYLIRVFPATELQGTNTIVSHAVEQMSLRYYDANCSIDDIARIVGISRSQMYRLFMHDFGISPKQYLTNLRMRRAAELLPRLSVKEVADSVGYAEPIHFSSAFKRYYGVSPSRYKPGNGDN